VRRVFVEETLTQTKRMYARKIMLRTVAGEVILRQSDLLDGFDMLRLRLQLCGHVIRS